MNNRSLLHTHEWNSNIILSCCAIVDNYSNNANRQNY